MTIQQFGHSLVRAKAVQIRRPGNVSALVNELISTHIPFCALPAGIYLVCSLQSTSAKVYLVALLRSLSVYVLCNELNIGSCAVREKKINNKKQGYSQHSEVRKKIISLLQQHFLKCFITFIPLFLHLLKSIDLLFIQNYF